MLEGLIAHYANGNKARFAKIVGVSPQAINTWLARNTFDVDKIFANCEYVNGDWLLSGEGEMLKRQPAQSVGNGATAIGENAIAGAVIHGGINEKGGLPDAVLQERIESLEKLLAEKERLIQVLLKVKVPSEGLNS